MILVPRVERFGKGWWPWKHARLPVPDGEPVPSYDGACIECGGCGRGVALSNHQIAADGIVSPSVVCPYAGCGWHVFLRLAGWAP